MQCIELCLDFPFEQCLLNIIEYCELIEQSCLDSKLDQTIALFTDYLKIPILDVKIRILKKIIIRLQLREELLKDRDSKVKSKFLSKFLHRKQILKLISKELLLPSMLSEDGLIAENDFTNLVIQCISMLLNSGEIKDKRAHALVMHNYQIADINYMK